MQGFTYRCFDQDLTGFINLHCTRPRYQHLPRSPASQNIHSIREFNPAKADCRLQDSATFPSITTNLKDLKKYFYNYIINMKVFQVLLIKPVIIFEILKLKNYFIVNNPTLSSFTNTIVLFLILLISLYLTSTTSWPVLSTYPTIMPIS